MVVGLGHRSNGEELVVRFGPDASWYEADRMAMAFDGPCLPCQTCERWALIQTDARTPSGCATAESSWRTLPRACRRSRPDTYGPARRAARRAAEVDGPVHWHSPVRSAMLLATVLGGWPRRRSRQCRARLERHPVVGPQVVRALIGSSREDRCVGRWHSRASRPGPW